MSVRGVVDKFGGQTALAMLVGVNQSAVAYWVKRGSIPSKWHAQLLELANQNGLSIDPSELIAAWPNMTVVKEIINDEQKDETLISLANDTIINDLPNNDINQSLTQGNSQFLFYASGNGKIKIQVVVQDETVWASQKGMGDIFGVEANTITYHLKEIFSSDELNEISVTRKIRVTAADGKNYDTNFYNLDAIISVGYRVNSYQATQFRKWATTVLKGYLIKGFALDDERLKQGNQLFGKDYFEELLERIRKIRASERMFWQKVTDLYSQCSVDYDKNSPITKDFFTGIQNKFHFAIHHHTSAELIKLRADASKPNMGLTHFANMDKDGVVLPSDAKIGKNYLTVDELDELERLVENYLGSAELLARRKIVMTMKDWVQKLDEFLRFNAYDVLQGYGKVSRETAEKHALTEYNKFRVVHEKEYKSDFDKIVDEIRIKKRLPKT